MGNDKETQLEAVADDRSAQDATADGAAADSPGQSSNPGHHDEEEESLMEQASEIAETAEEKAEEAVHQLAAAGNAAAELLRSRLGWMLHRRIKKHKTMHLSDRTTHQNTSLAKRIGNEFFWKRARKLRRPWTKRAAAARSFALRGQAPNTIVTASFSCFM